MFCTMLYVRAVRRKFRDIVCCARNVESLAFGQYFTCVFFVTGRKFISCPKSRKNCLAPFYFGRDGFMPYPGAGTVFAMGRNFSTKNKTKIPEDGMVCTKFGNSLSTNCFDRCFFLSCGIALFCCLVWLILLSQYEQENQYAFSRMFTPTAVSVCVQPSRNLLAITRFAIRIHRIFFSFVIALLFHPKGTANYESGLRCSRANPYYREPFW